MECLSISELKKQHDIITMHLKENGELTLQFDVTAVYTKNLLIAISSYFENEITDTIREYAGIVSNNDTKLVSFVDNVLERRYHQMFEWKANNANAFFSKFGITRQEMKSLLPDDAVQAFMQIGRERNYVAHNFYKVDTKSTFSELYQRYQNACVFLQFIKDFFGIPKKSQTGT